MNGPAPALRNLLRDLAVFGAIVGLYLLMMLFVLPRFGFQT